MRVTKNILILGFVYVLLAVCFYFALMVLPPVMELGDSYRIFFFHLPNAIVAYVALTITLVGSVFYLSRRDLKYDKIASSSAKLGLLFCSLALISGSIFSLAAWGPASGWISDPKVITFLITWFVYAAYLSLRSAIEEDDTRARVSAVLGIFGYATVPLAYLSTRIWYLRTHHPKGSIGLESNMWAVLWGITFGLIILLAYLLWWDFKLKNLEEEYQRLQSLAKEGN